MSASAGAPPQSGSLPDGRFDAEWFWVLGYGLGCVVVAVTNVLVVCSVLRNAFLRASNTHRMMAALALRNVLRVAYALTVLYSTRWAHPRAVSPDTTEEHFHHERRWRGHKAAPLSALCDWLCFLDVFLLSLPLYLLVSAAVHAFTRFPVPNLIATARAKTDRKHFYDVAGAASGSLAMTAMASSSSAARETGGAGDAAATASKQHLRALMPKGEAVWVALLLPAVPILMSALLAAPVPLLHLEHALQPVPAKRICAAASVGQHLTFDVSVFILGFCLPVVLLVCLALGLTLRRCMQCTSGLCCNSRCKEEAVIVQLGLVLAVSQILLFVPTLTALAERLGAVAMRDALQWAAEAVGPEVARALEVAAGGLALPALVYVWLPAYSRFRSEPDPRDASLLRRAADSQRARMRKLEDVGAENNDVAKDMC